MNTVLVVEDDPLNWRLFQKIITKIAGLIAKHSEDVEQIINLALNREADVILMDISLENSFYQGRSIDGIKITQLLKSNPQTAKIPVILVTSNGTESDRPSFLRRSGADGYIPKPVLDHQDFARQIKVQLGNK